MQDNEKSRFTELRKKPFHRKCQVEGVILDKATQTVLCTLSVDLMYSGALLHIIWSNRCLCKSIEIAMIISWEDFT